MLLRFDKSLGPFDKRSGSILERTSMISCCRGILTLDKLELLLSLELRFKAYISR
jgi:hypothetical protein